MVTIHTTDDFLRAMDENPQWKEAVRRAILTEELMNLPARFDEFVAEQRQFNAEQRQINAEQRQFNAEQQQFNAEIRQFRAEQQQFNAEQQQFNAEQRQTNATLTASVARLENTPGKPGIRRNQHPFC